MVCGGSGEMFVVEYDGKFVMVYWLFEGVFCVCVWYLNDELGFDVLWDWFEDEFGWVMWWVDMDIMKLVSLFGGKVIWMEVGE